MALRLKIIIGSTRPGRVGPTVAKWAEKFASEQGKFDVELLDLADFKLPLFDEPIHPAAQQYQHAHTKRWAEAINSADAFLFVTPEYDYFPPAGLVNAIQFLLKEWFYKPAGILSYGGISGGLRSAQVLRQLLGNVNVHAHPQVVPVPMVQQFIGEDGVFSANGPMVEGMTALLEELNTWGTALKPIRS